MKHWKLGQTKAKIIIETTQPEEITTQEIFSQEVVESQQQEEDVESQEQEDVETQHYHEQTKVTEIDITFDNINETKVN